jgi:MinD-like ATPase involved in chromosome partitioning or flagellar assembly/tetratricopeptide (TPR) repeat protein
MTENRDGQVVTFYSFKGGTGRTMALANVAWILAANGKRVLVVDWDLESPGLHRFFAPFIEPEAFKTAGGVVDLIRAYEWATLRGEHEDEHWHERFARVRNYAFSLNWHEFPAGGQLDFLAAGRQDRNYLQLLASLNWDNFYDRLGGGQFFDALRTDMKRQYDYTLIDSRTGLSDIADICTIHLPDTLVDCFTLSEQGIDGAAQVAREVETFYRGRNIRILPVPMRVDPAEKQKADAGREVARQRFAGLPKDQTDHEREQYWAGMHVPYQAYYAYEEMLATFGDLPGVPGSLLAAYESLTGHITHGEVASLPSMDATTRSQINTKFIRTPSAAVEEVTLRYAAEDEIWAEWIGSVLRSAGVRVHDDGADQRAIGGPNGRSVGRSLVIVSSATPTYEQSTSDNGKVGALAVYLSEGTRLRHAAANSVRISGQNAGAAALSIMGLVGRRGADVDSALAGGPRYPGDGPVVFNVPVQNPRFTGREADLHRLRSELLVRRTPVVLQGLGGVGKTQLAMEYAYRFRSAYDVVWWIDAGQARFVDVQLAGLGPEIGIPSQTKTEDNTRSVLQALSRGEPYSRWLVILDNADEQAAVDQWVPRGSGHVLITSRATEWADRAAELPVDVFHRAESVAHLRKRATTLTLTDAERVAEAVGDLPIAVSAAGAWLATGAAVDEYLGQIAEHGPKVLSGGPTSEQRVEATWDPSLQRLEERSPGAYRLLQYCSVLAPEIALDLVYSDEMALALKPVDPAVSDRLYRASLVVAINKFALLKIDQSGEQGPGAERLPGGERGSRAGQIVVHRLVQQVVSGRMSGPEQESARHQMHLMLAAAAARLEVDNPEDWPRFRMLWPHLEASGAVSCQDEPVRQLLIERIRYLWLLGGLEQGQELARKIEQTWVDRLADADVPDAAALRRQMLHLRFNLANILRDFGDFEESKELDEAGLPAQRALLGPQHPHTLLSAGGLAGDLRGLGRYPEALELDEVTYASWADTLGEDHPRTLTALSNLAVCHRLMGNFNRALELDVQVFHRRQSVLPDNHPNILLANGNVARDLREAGRFDESIDILREVVGVYGRVWGEDSRGALGEQTNLAVSLRSVGRAVEAADLLDRAYLRLFEDLGERRPETLACRLSRAINLLALDRNDTAFEELVDVRDAYQDSLGASHPHTIACVTNLAAAIRARGDENEAAKLARAAANDFGLVLGPDHPYTLAALTNLAICSAEVGDLSTASVVIDDLTPRSVRVLGENHPDTLRCRANHVLITRLLGHGNPEVAREEETVLRLLTDSLRESHPAVEALRHARLLHRTIDPHPF